MFVGPPIPPHLWVAFKLFHAHLPTCGVQGYEQGTFLRERAAFGFNGPRATLNPASQVLLPFRVLCAVPPQRLETLKP